MDEKKPTIAGRSPIVTTVEAGTYRWCTCGLSKNQPYCDGSHKGSGFVPLKVEISEKKQVAFCTCKHTSNPPYCDGAHSKLP